MAIIRERMRWLRYALQMNDDILSKIFLFGLPSRAKQKAGCPWLGWGEVVMKDLRGMGTSWEGVNREALNKLVWKRSTCSCMASGGLVLW